jgi:hypothetical protein
MCGSGRDEEPSGGEALRLIQIRLATLNFEKISLARQGNLPQTRTATSSSTNADSFSSGAQRNAFRLDMRQQSRLSARILYFSAIGAGAFSQLIAQQILLNS